MKRVVWLTDIHLNFVDDEAIDALFDSIRGTEPDAILISGDIAESHDVVSYLTRIDNALQRPVFFVLGNHDFYFGSIERTRNAVRKLCNDRANLHFLSISDPVELTPHVSLIGHDGWADGRLGDYERSYVMMNDYKLIEELAGVDKLQRWELLKQLGDEAAEFIRPALSGALLKAEHVLLVTHVPPLREACWHEGRISDDEWAPHFTCKAMGDAILDIMSDHPRKRLTVLCGHTHGSGETRPLDNTLIVTGGAVYGKPAICRVFDLE